MALVLNVGWLNGVISEAEWQADIASINAAARAAAAPVGSTSGEEEAAAAALLKNETAVPAVLANGLELIRFVSCGRYMLDTYAHRFFIWWQDGAFDSSDALGALYWNEYDPERVRSADNCFRMAYLKSGQRDGASSHLRFVVQKPGPSHRMHASVSITTTACLSTAWPWQQRALRRSASG